MKPIRPTSASFSSLLAAFLLTGLCGFTQTAAPDTARRSGLRLGFDLSRLANYYITERKVRSLEFSADLTRGKLVYVAEAGGANISKTQPTYEFATNGLYGRLGIERNMLKGGNDVMFFGARYALGAFTFGSNRFVAPDTYWGNYVSSIENQNFTAHWLEGVSGLKGNVWRNFYLGFTIRFKLRVALSGNQDLGSITIPGFGDAARRSAFGFNYYVFYQIPFRK